MPGNPSAGLLLLILLAPGLSRAQTGGRPPTDVEQFSWKPLDFFEPPKAGPDFDGDGGGRQRVMERAPDPETKPGDAKAASAGAAARGAGAKPARNLR